MRPIARARGWVQSLHPLVLDGLLAVVLTAALLVDLWQQSLPEGGPLRGADPFGYAIVALLVLPLALRRVAPVWVFLTILAAAVTCVALLYRPSSFGFGLLVATYTVARWRDSRVSVPVLWLSLTFALLAKLRAVAAGITVAWFDWPLDFVYFSAAWFLGASIRIRNRYARELEESRSALAEHAVFQERIRIARELHDGVGHSLSVMVLHAGGGEEILERNPDRARRAFRSISEVGRASLDEMDRLVGLLRADHENVVPRRRLRDLEALVDIYRGLGLDVLTRIEEQPYELPPAVEQSACAIVEESLTNTIKHAGPTKAEVSVSYDGANLLLMVRDQGPAGPNGQEDGRPPRVGRGIIGMRERAALVQGEVTTGRDEGGGFTVSAWLPIPPAR